VVLPPALAKAETTFLIESGARWKFEDTGSDLMTAWRDPTFNDDGWDSGYGVLGYGKNFINTIISFGGDELDKHPTTYFRIDFQLANDPSSFEQFSLFANYNDGMVVYLNGEEIARRSLPVGAITYNTFASQHALVSYEYIDVTPFIGNLVQGTNTLAVEMHQQSPESSDLVMDCYLILADDPFELRRGPYLQMGAPTRMTVRWRSIAPVSSTVRYGDAPINLLNEVSDSALTTEHLITLTDLAPDTKYYYAIVDGGTTVVGGGDAHHFTTSPLAGTFKPIRIWAFGDSGKPGTDQRNVRDAYYDYTDDTPTDVWLMLGDNAYSVGTDVQYQEALFDSYDDLLITTPLWPTRGNHDNLYVGIGNDYYDIFSLPDSAQAGGMQSDTEAYYSFDHGNVHFICLDSEGGSRELPGGAMLPWLTNDLASTMQDWIIAFWHHPPYSRGSHDSDVETRMISMRQYILPVLEAGGVDLVLTGHSHSYERSYLLDGHYGPASTFAVSHKVDAGDGDPVGDGAYVKPISDPGHQGAVYAVVGSASKTGGGPLNHPAMIVGLDELGSLVIDIGFNRLDAKFLDDAKMILDSFTILKEVGTGIGTPADRTVAGLRAAPNPFGFRTALSYSIPRAGYVRLEIFDLAGRRVRTLVSEARPAGKHEAQWGGLDSRGVGVASGAYVSRLDLDGKLLRSSKLLVVR